MCSAWSPNSAPCLAGVEEVLGAPIPEALSGKGEVLGLGIANDIDYQLGDAS